jgi:hypothetical protein
MAVQQDLSIMQIEDAVEALGHEEHARFHRIFHVSSTSGRLVPPDAMIPWIEKQFGSVEPTLDQKIIKVTNVVTLEGVLFNWLRSSRPMWRQEIHLDEELERTSSDPLHDPYNGTPEDTFGRVRGRFCVTASNIAKFDGYHGLVVFNERHPLRFTRDMLHDYIDTGGRWGDLAHASDPDAKYYMFLWNCLWRAGASLLHGHAQVIMGRGAACTTPPSSTSASARRSTRRTTAPTISRTSSAPTSRWVAPSRKTARASSRISHRRRRTRCCSSPRSSRTP